MSTLFSLSKSASEGWRRSRGGARWGRSTPGITSEGGDIRCTAHPQHLPTLRRWGKGGSCAAFPVAFPLRFDSPVLPGCWGRYAGREKTRRRKVSKGRWREAGTPLTQVQTL